MCVFVERENSFLLFFSNSKQNQPKWDGSLKFFLKYLFLLSHQNYSKNEAFFASFFFRFLFLVPLPTKQASFLFFTNPQKAQNPISFLPPSKKISPIIKQPTKNQSIFFSSFSTKKQQNKTTQMKQQEI